MEEIIEKSLVVGGVMVSMGVGNLYSFWHGVLAGGILLFAVALLFLLAELFWPATPGGDLLPSDGGGRS